MSELHFISNGYRLAGNLFVAAQPQKLAFLFIQGWMGHQNIRAAQRLAELGFTSMTYDMRGNGKSEGDLALFSRADFLSDAANAYDYLAQQLSTGTKIGVIGSSFGSYTGVLLSNERDVHCLSLRVPANYPDEGFENRQMPQSGGATLHQWRSQTRTPSQNRALQALHSFEGKVQIVEASADKDVPAQTCKNYANAVADKSKLTYVVMEGAPHTLIDDTLQAEYVHLLSTWALSA